MTRPIFVIGMLAHFSASAQYAKCTDLEVEPSRVDRICEEALPWSSLIWMPNSSGEPCYCDCRRARIDPLQDLASLREERLGAYQESASAFAASRAVLPGKRKGVLIGTGNAGPIRTTRATLSDGHLLEVEYIQELELCDDTRQLLSVVRAINSTGLIADFNVFISNTDDGNWEVPHNIQYEYEGRHSIALMVPNLFLKNEEVGYEAMAFFLLHEIGHAYRADESECRADEWAANIGMRALYPGPGLIQALQEVPKQYLRYKRSVTGDQSYVPGSSGPHCEVCYPDWSCRSNAIMNILECLSSPDGHGGYPTACFSTQPDTVDLDFSEQLCPANEVCGEVFEPFLLDHIVASFVVDKWMRTSGNEIFRSKLPKYFKPIANVLRNGSDDIAEADRAKLEIVLARNIRRLNCRIHRIIKAKP
jgi:hypothetical protein